eukprot:gene50015-61214_t
MRRLATKIEQLQQQLGGDGVDGVDVGGLDLDERLPFVPLLPAPPAPPSVTELLSSRMQGTKEAGSVESRFLEVLLTNETQSQQQQIVGLQQETQSQQQQIVGLQQETQ